MHCKFYLPRETDVTNIYTKLGLHIRIAFVPSTEESAQSNISIEIYKLKFSVVLIRLLPISINID